MSSFSHRKKKHWKLGALLLSFDLSMIKKLLHEEKRQWFLFFSWWTKICWHERTLDWLLVVFNKSRENAAVCMWRIKNHLREKKTEKQRCKKAFKELFIEQLLWQVFVCTKFKVIKRNEKSIKQNKCRKAKNERFHEKFLQ